MKHNLTISYFKYLDIQHKLANTYHKRPKRFLAIMKSKLMLVSAMFLLLSGQENSGRDIFNVYLFASWLY